MAEQRQGESYLDFRTRLIREARAHRQEYNREAKRWRRQMGLAQTAQPAPRAIDDGMLVFISTRPEDILPDGPEDMAEGAGKK